MGACARTIFQTELARPCAKMNSWDLVHFCLRDAGTKLISDLGFLASQILCFSASRLLGLSGGFSASRLQSTQLLFCQQCSPWVPPVTVWPWARVQSVQRHGSQSVQWFCLVSRSERASIIAKCSQYGESTIIVLPVSVGHSCQEPLCLREACANLAQNSGCVKSSRVKITRNSCLHGLLPFKIHDIHSKSCLLKLTIPLQARGPTYQANNATRKQRNSSPISSRPIMLCNPFRCIFIHFCFNFLRDFGLARNLRVHELARSLWKACARVTPFNCLKNKFHRILKSIAGSFERGSYVSG